jgi:hypothetical protein
MSELVNPSNQNIVPAEYEMNTKVSSTTENSAEIVKILRRRSNTPQTDNDNLAVLSSLIPKWDETAMPIGWMPKSVLMKLHDDYNTLSASRNTKGASRKPISSDLRALDDEIDSSIEHPKNRLKERFRSPREAIARYITLGIVKEKSYKLPTNREDRLKALDILLGGMNEYQFKDTDFGIDYWTDIKTRYEPLVKLARATDGTVSGNVGTLNQMRSQVRKFNNCFIHIVKANYPDSWKNVLRDFGFQKEKY